MIIAEETAYFMVHQFKDENGKPGAEILNRLTGDPDTDTFDCAFENLEHELKSHDYEDKYSVVKVRSELEKDYGYICGDEFDVGLYIEEVDFGAFLPDREVKKEDGTARAKKMQETIQELSELGLGDVLIDVGEVVPRLNRCEKDEE